ncbi:unnamed protein product [Closterium sp. Yama58-4]|nr:unnamed protein product [Closterium sp. Yama58-4]
MADAAARREARRRRILNQGNERLRFITGDATAMQSLSQQPSAASDVQDTAVPTQVSAVHTAEPQGKPASASLTTSPPQDTPPASTPLPGPASPTPPAQPQPDSTAPSDAPSVAEQAPSPSLPVRPSDHASTAPTFPFDPLAPTAPSFQHLPFLSAQLAQQQQQLQQQGVSAPLLGPRQGGAGGAFGAFQEPPRAQKRSTMRLLLSMQQLVLAAQATAPVRLAVALLLALLYCLRMLPLHCPHLTHWLPALAASAGAAAEAPEGLTAAAAAAAAAGMSEGSLSSQPSLLWFLFFLPAHPCLTVLATDAALIASSLVLQTFISPRPAAASPAGLAGLLQGLTAAARQSEAEGGGAGAAGASPLSEMMGMMERTGYWMARAGMVRDVLHGLVLNLSVFLVALGCAVAAAEAAGQHATCAAVEWGVEGAVRHGGGLLELCQAAFEGVQDRWSAVFQGRG